MILSIVLYRYETWSHSMGKTEKKEPTGEWIKLHNEVLICTQVIRSRSMRWVRYTACMGFNLKTSKEETTLETWEDNIWMDKMV
jgi:hypothetical protein